MKFLPRFSLLLVAATLVGCAGMESRTLKASVEIQPTSSAEAAGLKPTGRVTFTQMGSPGWVRVEAKIDGLKPNAEHGFHVHAVADCSGDGTKTAAHFNPDNNPHTHPGQPHRHAGAMFNLKTDANGSGRLQQDINTISLTPGRYSIMGLPLITHRDADDYKSQPLGNAGPRIACGLITAG